MKIFWLIFFSFSAFAVDPYILRPGGYVPLCDSSFVELQNLPPLRDQGVYGLCYAHSGMMLLDYMRCSNDKNPAACYENPGSVLHLAKFYSGKNEERIEVGGTPDVMLKSFLESRKLAPEKCAKYEDWKNLDQYYRSERSGLSAPPEDQPELDYFYYISKRLKKNASTDEMNCWAKELIDSGVEQNLQDIMAVLQKGRYLHWQELRFKLLVPKSCINQAISYPEYDLKAYPPTYADKKSFKGFRDFIFSALSNGVPLEASFKAGPGEYHSSTIVGQRHVCDARKCELQYKIHNSYGKSWQENNDGGWVNAKNLVNMMEEYSLGVTAIHPKGKSVVPKQSAAYYESTPANGRRSENCQEPSASFETARPSKQENGLWVCQSGGQTVMTDKPLSGYFCKQQKN